MTFIDFKKLLLDSELSIPKFTEIIKVSEKNIQAYKKKKQVFGYSSYDVISCFAGERVGAESRKCFKGWRNGCSRRSACDSGSRADQ